MPASVTFSRVGHPSRSDVADPYVEDIAASGLFHPATVRRYLWPRTYTAEQYVDVLSTYSVNLTMPEVQRRDFLDRRRGDDPGPPWRDGHQALPQPPRGGAPTLTRYARAPTARRLRRCGATRSACRNRNVANAVRCGSRERSVVVRRRRAGPRRARPGPPGWRTGSRRGRRRGRRRRAARRGGRARRSGRPSTTRIWSASRTVDSRCAMTSEVRPVERGLRGRAGRRPRTRSRGGRWPRRGRRRRAP